MKVPKKYIETLNEEEVRELKAKLRKKSNVRYFVLVSIAIATGMKSGELCGLRRQGVDLKRKTVTVVGTMKRQGSSFYWSPYGKSTRSLCTIDITKKDVALFRLLRLYQVRNKQYNENGYVFTTLDDWSCLTPMRIAKLWTELREKLGIKLTFHRLRHTCATL